MLRSDDEEEDADSMQTKAEAASKEAEDSLAAFLECEQEASEAKATRMAWVNYIQSNYIHSEPYMDWVENNGYSKYLVDLREAIT